MPASRFAEAPRVCDVAQPVIPDDFREHAALLEILDSLCIGQAPVRNDQFVQEERFGDWEADTEVTQDGFFRKIDEHVDEGKGQGRDVPFLDRDGIGAAVPGPVRDELHLITAGGELPDSVPGEKIRETETDDQIVKVGAHLFPPMCNVDREVDIQRLQRIADVVQVCIDRHDPTADEKRSFEEANPAQRTKQFMDFRRETDVTQNVRGGLRLTA